MKEKDDLMSDLKRIADIAHAGGLCGLDAFDALRSIRYLTSEHFDVGRTEKQMKMDVHYSIVEAEIKERSK